MISMCSFRSSIGMPELAGDLRHLVVLQQPQVLGDDLLGRRAFEPEVADLQPQAFLQVARGDADRVEGLHVLQRLLDVRDRPLAHRRDLFDRGHQVAVVVEVADDGAADLLAACSSSVCIDSCQSRWSESEAAVESVFSIGGSSLTSDGVRDR